MEEMRNDYYGSLTRFTSAAICSVFAVMALHFIIGPQAAIKMKIYHAPDLNSLWLFFIFGIITGCAGFLYNIALIRCLAWVDLLSNQMRFLFLLAVGLLIGSLAYYLPEAVGGGYRIIETSLAMKQPFALLTLLLILRYGTSILSYSTAYPVAYLPRCLH